MFGWADEANMYAMVDRGGGKIGATADQDRAAAAGEAPHELIGFLHKIPEVGVQADELADGSGDFRNFILGEKTSEVWR
jgi:hypothetical protein